LGGSDVFISKLDATGSSLVYATYLGGSAGDFGKRIALDGTGAVYVTGQTFSLDYPTTPGSFQTSATANTNEAFVTKLDPTGSRLIYSTFLGGAEGLDAAYGLGVDSTGAAVVFGFTGSSDFPATGGTFHPNNFDVFVAKFTPSGDALAWANFLGGSNEEDAYNLALDRAGNVYVTGQTASSDFPVTANALDPTKNSAFDAFVTQFTPTGNLAYSTYLGSSGYDGGLGLTVDKMGSVYVVGTVGDLDLPTTLGSYDPTYNGNGDAFLSKIKVQP
jgi:hypothetical protein